MECRISAHSTDRWHVVKRISNQSDMGGVPWMRFGSRGEIECLDARYLPKPQSLKSPFRNNAVCGDNQRLASIDARTAFFHKTPNQPLGLVFLGS